jgi:hypothetical protein
MKRYARSALILVALLCIADVPEPTRPVRSAARAAIYPTDIVLHQRRISNRNNRG